MPASKHRHIKVRSRAAGIACGLALALPCGLPVAAPLPANSVESTVSNSPLDAQLFYQLLISELELRSGAAGTAHELMLDAARRQRDELLFKRAADIALQARAGDQALAAARAWRSALPKSVEAHRYVVQLLVALGRPGETVEPLRSLIRQTEEQDRPALIAALPRFFAIAGDKKVVPGILEQVLDEPLRQPATRVAALQALAGASMLAQDLERAHDHAREAQSADPAAEAPVLIALQLLPKLPAAEGIVTAYLGRKPDNSGMRILYARVLSGAQRFTDAIEQLELVTRTDPERPAAWLTLGALQLELRHAAEATRSLETYLQLADKQPAAATTVAVDDGTGDDEGPEGPDPISINHEQARLQAWLMLAQAAEQQGDFKGAETWLSKVDNPQRALEVQQRRASLLAKQGKLAEARALLQRLPEKDGEAARAKLFAEAQLLRDAKMWQAANDVLAKGSERFPADIDLIYERSMLAEKLDRLDEMEQLLRRVIELKPDHQHAHNALGYSLAERNIRLPEAKQLIQRALELSPGDPFITDSLGWVEYRLGNTDEAVRLLRAAYRMRPDTEIGAHLGEVLWVTGQVEEARRIWREARTRDAANDVLRETLARLRAEL